MNREDIMKREGETNIFLKILHKIKTLLNNGFGGFLKFLLIFLLIICGFISLMIHLDKIEYPYGDYEMVYKVYWNQYNVKTYTITHNRPIIYASEKGTNYIKKYNDGYVVQTSSPIEVVKYVNHKK